MIGLPYGLAEPLHIDEPFPTWKLVLAGLLLWFGYRLFLLFRARASRSPAVPPPPPLRAETGFAAVVGEIRRRYQGNYRRGCHEIAAALRRYFDQEDEHATTSGPPYPTLTAREIAGHIGDTTVSRLFDLLSDLQFRRREPTQGDFEGACDLALDVVETGRSARGIE